MLKVNLLDTTFTIPVRIESPERLDHLKTVIKYMNTYAFTNILIGESSPEPTQELKRFCQKSGCGYVHFKDDNKYFHRTKLLNDMSRIAGTTFIVNHDADVLTHPHSMQQAIELLRTGNCDLVIPYEGTVINVSGESLKRIKKSLSIAAAGKDCKTSSKKACGGVIYWNKQRFFGCGMENENFIDWGFEDNERLTRAKKFGMEIHRLTYGLYHFDHVKVNNDEHPHKKGNAEELKKIVGMGEKELLEYVRTWKWL